MVSIQKHSSKALTTVTIATPAARGEVALPELGRAIADSREVAMRRWEAQLPMAVPGLARQPRGLLRDGLPSLIDKLADIARTGPGGLTSAVLAESAGHGQLRAESDVEVGELIAEFQILRGVLVEVLPEVLGRPMTPAERQFVIHAMDTAVRQSATFFEERSRRRLDASNEAMATYLAFLSHDLRGRLNSTVLIAEVLREELCGEPKFKESLADVETMRRSILETVATMDRFLQAERLRQGKMPVERRPMRLRSVLLEVADVVRAELGPAAGSRVRIACEPGLQVDSDAEALKLVLHNLVGNALKFAPEGEVLLAAEVVGEDRVRLDVSDEGPGIEPNSLPSLLQPFTRGRTTDKPGTGLGLFITKQAADLIGATLAVDSSPGHGTTFHVFLPGAK